MKFKNFGEESYRNRRYKDNNGIIPRFFRQLHCGLWKGHNYKAVSPEYQGVRVWECQKCGKTSVF